MAFRISVWMVIFLGASLAIARAQDPNLYELRVYQPTPGHQQDLLQFIDQYLLQLAKSNGLDIVAALVPIDAADERIVTVVRHQDRAACDKAYEKMAPDPANIPVDSVTRLFLTKTDYSPDLRRESVGHRVFELRSYIASPGNLEALNRRFRNHTLKLFAKHGMNNLIYWNIDDGGAMKAVELLGAVSPKDQAKAEIAAELPAQGNTLVYFLTHASTDAAKASFDAFRQDPDWNAARTQSEKNAGGSLTANGGVKSWFLKPTDFSPLK